MEAIDLLSSRVFANPYPIYRQMRDAAPLIGLRPGIWATGRYSVADLLLRDRRAGRNFIERSTAVYGEQAIKGEVFQSFGQTLLLMNPPSHTRLRALLSKAFNAEQMSGFQHLAQQTANRLVDRLEQLSSADLVQAYAYPLPLNVICSLLDMPGEDAAVLTETSLAAIRAIEVQPMTPSQIDEANTAVRRLYTYFTDIIGQRRMNPGNDLVSLLLAAKDGKESLSEEEIIANVMMLFIAGYETTSGMICNALITLHRHPEELARVKADPSLLPDVVAECLRYESSLQVTARAVLDDMEISGIRLRKGDTVYVYLGAANRDPQRFTDPDRFILGRGERPLNSMSFGGGAHFCLGARLATTQLEIALGTLFRRLPKLRLTNLDTLCWRPTSTFRSVEALHAQWLSRPDRTGPDRTVWRLDVTQPAAGGTVPIITAHRASGKRGMMKHSFI